MDNIRSDGLVRGGKSESDAAGAAPARSEILAGNSVEAREGDVIQGLRNGLMVSLAIWVMLFAIGAVVFG